jgi:hypothetical protein
MPNKKEERYGAITGLTKRSSQVQVRLVSSALGSPLQVKLTPSEYDAIHAAARAHTKEGHISAFLRDLAVAASSHLHAEAASQPADMQVKWCIEKLGDECAMLPGELLRALALEAINYTSLCAAAARAREALEAKALWHAEEE